MKKVDSFKIFSIDTETSDPEALSKQCKTDKTEGNIFLGTGLGLGALSATTLLTVGAACPLCYVAVPALIGAGVFKRHKAKKIEKKLKTDTE